MNANDLFNPGITDHAVPESDPSSQAVDSLRGYAYQAIATTLAWINLSGRELLFLEVAEDYAIVADHAIQATQVKDTGRSESVTLNNKNIRAAITSFVDLVERNPDAQVYLRFLTTSKTGTERATHDRPSGMPGLEYWRRASAPSARTDTAPLREILQSDRFPNTVQSFCRKRDDKTLRRDLFQRITWDCGKPDYTTIRRELDAHVIVLGRDHFDIPVEEAPRIGDQLIYHVLQKCILKEPSDRVLTRADLYRVIESKSRVSIPRAAVDRVAKVFSTMASSNTGSDDSHRLVTDAADDWLIDGNTIPRLRGMIPRCAVESALSESLTTLGAAVLVGGSGLGKSTVSHRVADTLPGDFTLVQFGHTDATRTTHRLDMLLGTIAGLRSSRLILDDLSYFEHPRVCLFLARIVESTRRHHVELIITSSRRPSITELAEANLTDECVIDCGHFDEDETRDLVVVHGGDPEVWARFAHVAGAHGHPQLTHAFVIGTAARGWPMDETNDILRHGLLSDDIAAARDVSRRRLVYALPESNRELLYRLSLTTGPFTRSVALAAGDLAPSVPQIGECFDQLVGPWISAVGNDQFSVSPLASHFGRDNLSADQQRMVHRTIASQMLDARTIDAGQADTIMMHSIVGSCPKCLSILAHSILSTQPTTLAKLADHYPLFILYRTDTPIYHDDLHVSGLLRLAQFKIAVSGRRKDKVDAIVHALLREIYQVADTNVRDRLETIVLISILSTMGISNYLDDWVAHLVRCKSIVATDPQLGESVTNVERNGKVGFSAALFSIGVAGLASIQRLESIIDALDELVPSERALMLAPIRPEFSDYSDIISGPWIAQHKERDFDAREAAIRYERMARKTMDWQMPALSAQCTVVQAIMLDEYDNDPDGALAALKDAGADEGGHPVLSRAMGNVHMRHGRHDTALSIFRRIADTIGHDNPIERTFCLRNAAMSAAECENHAQAAKWFLDACRAAKVAKTSQMDAMAVGLLADSAVASLEAGDQDLALSGLAKAIDGLRSIDPDETLRTAYCHRVVRHTVLWVQSKIEGIRAIVGVQPLVMKPGICSNPDPPEDVRELPLGDVDVAWYTLAKAEAVSDVDLNIVATIGDRLAGEPIPAMELLLRTKVMQKAIDTLNSESFVSNFVGYIELAAHFLREPTEMAEFDPLNPKRGRVPRLSELERGDPAAEEAAKDAIISFMLGSTMAGCPHLITLLRTTLGSRLSDWFPGGQLMGAEKVDKVPVSELEIVSLNIIALLLRNDYIRPDEILAAGLGIFDWTCRSSFGLGLAEALSRWLRTQWQRIVTSEAFRFVRPWQTVRVINDALAVGTNDRAFAANLLLAAADAVGIALDSGHRDRLEYAGGGSS